MLYRMCMYIYNIYIYTIMYTYVYVYSHNAHKMVCHSLPLHGQPDGLFHVDMILHLQDGS